MSRKQPEFSVKPLQLIDEGLIDDFTPEGSGGEGMLHLKDLIPRLLARWHWIALCLILGLAIGSYRVWRAVPQYEARATVLVRDNNVNAMGKLDAAEFDLRNVAALSTVQAGMTTFELCEAVASDPGVRELKGLIPPRPKSIPFVGGGASEDSDAPATPVLAGMIQEWISAKVRKDTRLIDIEVTHAEPEVAQTIANEVVTHYMKLRTESRSGDTQDNLSYLMAESKRVRKELQEAQNVLASYSAPLKAEKELTVAEAAVDTLGLRYGPKHPKMIQAQGTYQHSWERLRDGLLRAINNTVDAEYWAPYREGAGTLETPEAVNPFRDLLISRHAVLESEIASQNSLYTTLMDQIKTLELTTDNPEAEVAPHEAARLPVRPVSPNKMKILLASTFLGLFAGLGLAFVFQYFDNRFHTVADVESQLRLPVLAAIAELHEKEMLKEEAKLKKTDEPPAWVSGREQWAPLLVFRTEGAKSHYAEMFRVLRTSISLLGPADQRKITMVTSALPSEGKTLVAANLAVALAQQGVKTLLVDFDLRKPSVHKMFGATKDGQPGIVDLLAGNADLDRVLQPQTGQTNLALSLSGPKAPNPGELLESGRLVKLLALFRERFDHIVIDTAPLLAVPDSRILAPLVDNLALVVHAESTPRGPVKRALEILDHSGITPEGIVFNAYIEKRSLIGKNYSYGYYRYGKYGYGKYEYGSYGSVYGDNEE